MIYQTKQVQERVGPISLALDCLEDFEASVDQLFAELSGNPDFQPESFEILCPYFGVLWPPARILGEYLAKLGELVFHNKKILEVGCGLALPSLVAATLGAEVTASDWHPDVPVFLRRNELLNGLRPINYRRADWFADDASELRDLGLFDVIIGSDVLYDPAHPRGLCNVVERHLAPHGYVIVADANRSYAAEFAKMMQKLGFDCQVREQLVTGNLPRQSTGEIVVKVYEFHRV